MKDSPGLPNISSFDSNVVYDSIFENSAVSIWEEDFSWCKTTIEKLKSNGVVDFKKYLQEYPHFVTQSIGSVKIRNVNKKSVELFEAGTKEELMVSLNKIFLPETLPIFENELLAIAQGQTQFESEVVVRTLTGKRLDVLLLISFPENAIGFERVYVTIIDITKRKETEAKLLSSENQYRSLVEQATDGIFVSDSNGKYVDVNQSGCTMLGYSRDEILHLNVRDLLPPGDAQNNPPKFTELVSGKVIKNIRRLTRKDGTTVLTEINAKMLPSGEMLGMVRDITDRQQAAQKLLDSEEKFRNLTETAFDAIVIMDEERNIIFWNSGAEHIFGYEKHEVIDSPMSVIIPEKYRKSHDEGITRYLATNDKKVIGRVVTLEGIKKSGEVFPIEISIASWQVGNGKLFSGIIRDITERKKIENEIKQLNVDLEQKVKERTSALENKILQYKESEEKFQKVFYSSSAGISVTRLSDARYIDVNPAFEEVTGYTRDELINHTSLELGIVLNINKREEVYNQIKEFGFAKQFEMTVQNKSGQVREVISSAETITLNGEKLVINVIYDITERKLIEQQLATANKELESFSYSVSHDLRAPLRAVIGYSEMLTEDYTDKIDSEGLRYLSTIQRNAKRMNVLIDDLLNFSKLGKKELNKTQVDCDVLVRRLVRELSENSSYSGKFSISNLPTVDADAGLLTQVWSNLISNAIKYSGKMSDSRVQISSYVDNNENVFSVQDNGVGFDMKYVDKLFGVFQRLHTVEEFEGTGVGLSIVQRIVKKHKGRVWAEGRPNEGAVFSFSLPL